MRYKEYNTQKVLETCMHLFWEKGFKGCSIQEVVSATGVNRFSLYQEFDDKNGILYHTLKLYQERYSSTNLKLLLQDGDATNVLSQFFLSFFDGSRPYPGCFLIHIGTELADTDKNINKLVRDYLEELSEAIESMLVSRGYSFKEARHYADHLTGLFCTSMSFCLIHSENERRDHINNGIEVIFNKEMPYATSIE